MGIPNYFLHIVKKYRYIIKKMKNIKIDNLYLDSNSIIYDTYYKIKNENLIFNNIADLEQQIIINVCLKIEEYIRKVSPKKKVYIAFDGIAPIAKLSQQRKRRFLSDLEKKINDTKDDMWNTTSITPGTEFMKNLSLYINDYFKQKEYIISTSEEAGEGEHKIFEYMRLNKEYHMNTVTVIYGMDADLFMLSLNHTYLSKYIYLYRETPDFIHNIDKTLNPNEGYLLDINELSNKIILQGNFNIQPEQVILQDNYKKQYLSDYILLCYLLGNDFLPHYPSLNIRDNGMDILMNTYNDIKKKNKNFNITYKNNINWKNFKVIINIISKREKEFICNSHIKRGKYKNLKNELLNIPLISRDVENYINPFDLGWEKRYYKKLLKIDYDEERIKQICINYLEGLEWTFKYYTTKCENYYWKYNYNYPPLLIDLLKYIPYFNIQLLKKCEYNIEKPITQITHLAYVIPYDSLYLLPDKIYIYLKNNYKFIYTSDIDIQWSYCRYFWESHVDMYNINIVKLNDIINNI